MVWRYACVFFRILKLFFTTGFLLQFLGNWYRTNGPLVNFTIFNTSNKNKVGGHKFPMEFGCYFLVSEWGIANKHCLLTFLVVFLLNNIHHESSRPRWPGGRGFNPRWGRQHSFMEIDHEIFSTVILSLPLIQEGQLSVSGERMCTLLVNRLED